VPPGRLSQGETLGKWEAKQAVRSSGADYSRGGSVCGRPHSGEQQAPPPPGTFSQPAPLARLVARRSLCDHTIDLPPWSSSPGRPLKLFAVAPATGHWTASQALGSGWAARLSCLVFPGGRIERGGHTELLVVAPGNEGLVAVAWARALAVRASLYPWPGPQAGARGLSWRMARSFRKPHSLKFKMKKVL